MHFERMVNDKWHKKLEADYNMCYWTVNPKVFVKMLTQAREIYTKMMFEDFQDQFVEAVELSMKKWVQDGENFLYIVIMDDNSEKQYVKGKITTHYLVVVGCLRWKE